MLTVILKIYQFPVGSSVSLNYQRKLICFLFTCSSYFSQKIEKSARLPKWGQRISQLTHFTNVRETIERLSTVYFLEELNKSIIPVPSNFSKLNFCIGISFSVQTVLIFFPQQICKLVQVTISTANDSWVSNHGRVYLLFLTDIEFFSAAFPN